MTAGSAGAGVDRRTRLVVPQQQRLPGNAAEVDDHVGPLGRCEHELVDLDRAIPHTALGPDLPEADAADVEAEDARVAAVQDPEPIHPGLDLEERPDLAVDQHRVPEVLADPGGALDVARRVEERSVSVEAAVLNHQRDLVRAAGNPDRIRLGAGVVLVTEDVRSGEPREHVQPRGAEPVVVKPEQRGGHLRQLVRVEDGLGLAGAEPVRCDRRVAVAVGSDEAAVEVRHQPHLVPERRQPRVDRDPVRIGGGKVVGEADLQGGAALRHDRHAERAGLTGQSGAVVVGPDRRRRQVGVELPRDLRLRERVAVGTARGRDDDSGSRER
jgi:hypothetical protein